MILQSHTSLYEPKFFTVPTALLGKNLSANGESKMSLLQKLFGIPHALQVQKNAEEIKDLCKVINASDAMRKSLFYWIDKQALDIRDGLVKNLSTKNIDQIINDYSRLQEIASSSPKDDVALYASNLMFTVFIECHLRKIRDPINCASIWYDIPNSIKNDPNCQFVMDFFSKQLYYILTAVVGYDSGYKV